MSVDTAPKPSVPERVVGWLSRRMSPAAEPDAPPGPPRRSFLGGAALVGAAVAATPWDYLTRPASAYDAICGSGNTCNDGWSVFCCTINGGQNTCPPDSFIGGWWKADNSSFCGGSARYYIDCNAFRDGAWTCHCNQTTCDQRLVACNQFRYGQCNTQIPWSNTGPVVCRVVSCTPPWIQFGGVCTSSSATDNNTVTHSAPCLVPSPALRIGVVGNDGNARAKAGSLWSGWVVEWGGAASMAVTGTRLGVVDRAGVARVKEGDLGASWVTVADNVASLQLDDQRIAVLGTDGVTRIKEGGLGAEWVTLSDQTTSLSIDGARIGVVSRGVALVKEGPVNADWHQVLTGARSIVVEGFRIAVVRSNGSVFIRDGSIDGDYTLLATNAASVTLDGPRIGVVLADGSFVVKEGPINAGWTLVATDVAQAVVRGQRIAVLTRSGTVMVKEGVIQAGWVTEWAGAGQVVLS